VYKFQILAVRSPYRRPSPEPAGGKSDEKNIKQNSRRGYQISHRNTGKGGKDGGGKRAQLL
jgi:hypothetical protein